MRRNDRTAKLSGMVVTILFLGTTMTLAFQDTQTHSITAERQIAQGEAMLGRGQHEAALAIADSVLAKDLDLASAWLLRGSACRALHRFAEAADAWRVLIDLFPDFVQMRV